MYLFLDETILSGRLNMTQHKKVLLVQAEDQLKYRSTY